jgi:RNA polymerase sigma-70 factor (ECF subfamily)
MKNTPAESSYATDGAVASGPGVEEAVGDEPVDLFRVWCRQLRGGDQGALESVFRALHTPLQRFALRHLDSDDHEAAADIVQDAFVRVWEGRERLDPDRSLKAFLYQTVRNLALNQGRDSRNRATLLAERYEAPTRAPARPDDVLDREVVRIQVEQWIEALPDRQKEALRLSRFDGLDHREIAEVMGCSPRTVNNHLVKALRALRDRAEFAAPERLKRR